MDNTNKIFVELGDNNPEEISIDDFEILIENHLDGKRKTVDIDDVFQYFLNNHDMWFTGDEKLICSIANKYIDAHNDEIRLDAEFEREQRYQDSIIPSAYTRKSDDMTDYEYYRMVGYETTR